MDGTYQVAREFESDAVLRGVIREIRKQQLRGVRTDTIRSQELGVYIYVEWYLEDPKTGDRIVTLESGADSDIERVQFGNDTIRVSPGIVVGQTVQFVDPSYQVGERNAFAPASEDAAKKLVSQLSNGW